MNVGVVGFSDSKKFNEENAKKEIIKAFDMLELVFKGEEFRIVSGLTNLGIPKLAYEEAVKRHWETVGIACSKANEHDLFDVDESKIVGNDWGDESETFLKYCDIFLRFGGGEQSLDEMSEAKKMEKKVFEYDIPQ